MPRTRLTLVAAAGLLLAGCSDATSPPAEAPPTAMTDAARQAIVSLEDAASRASPALEEPAAAADVQSGLTRLAQSLADGDRITALATLARTRAILAAYAGHASIADAVDRDVVALALDGAERALTGTLTQ